MKRFLSNCFLKKRYSTLKPTLTIYFMLAFVWVIKIYTNLIRLFHFENPRIHNLVWIFNFWVSIFDQFLLKKIIKSNTQTHTQKIKKIWFKKLKTFIKTPKTIFSDYGLQNATHIDTLNANIQIFLSLRHFTVEVSDINS